jgi:YihY family inner membrane protein
VSSTEPVPETRDMSGDELSADDAWLALRRYGRWPLVRDAFIRFRYGDGFSHARAFAFQLCLAAVPFMIAVAGLAADLGAATPGQVVADTIGSITPGQSEGLVRELLADTEHSRDAGEVALFLGLLTGLVALTTAMAQIERGANRIYGVERDRPALRKYLRAVILAMLAGLPALFGFVLLVAGRPFGESAERHWGWAGHVRVAWDVVRWPVSLVLIVIAVGLIFRYAPRRHQPALSWLLFGAVVSTVLWWLVSLLLAGYVRISGGFGATYGPLTGVIALLLWANLTGIALFLGLAFAAQLEAQRVGVRRPAKQDSWKPGRTGEIPRARGPRSRSKPV